MTGQSASASFVFGEGYGQLTMGLIACGIPTVTVSPQIWQKAFGLRNTDKLSKTESVSYTHLDVYKRQLLNNCRDTSKQIRQILKWGKAEVSHFVEYEGCKFKYRPDVETAKKIVDWKTLAVDDLHEETVNRTIAKFHYGISCLLYTSMNH